MDWPKADEAKSKTEKNMSAGRMTREAVARAHNKQWGRVKSNFIRKQRPAARPLRYLESNERRGSQAKAINPLLFTKGNDVEMSRLRPRSRFLERVWPVVVPIGGVARKESQTNGST